ncbi:carbon starvation CstA 5TM domain-containing protein [Blastococcus brunescens]|uniref:Carbon starvation CstA 5TM domain-containing protein n=2 Tax=Blastococcus brunescens TaxID=1564165 RepID=A0ABZ1B7F5_9ACTN|nr:carbon starvation CstA 5TM domain-containing protein [Blastococcus sp. BMG 8361]WRL65798.1 carbon starvation CstA 5TM domain-containing protein [Blastococcus sp. BMG 8361]
MDTGVRLQRYVVQEIGELIKVRVLARNLSVATTVAVVIPLAMALIPGEGRPGTRSASCGSCSGRRTSSPRAWRSRSSPSGSPGAAATRSPSSSRSASCW